MTLIFFSSDLDMIDEWKMKYKIDYSISCYDADSITKALNALENYIVIADYDSIATDINKMIASNTLPNNVIVLERTPEIATGEFLISHNIKAYGNSRMLSMHFQQMTQTVKDGNIWTYPELTSALGSNKHQEELKKESLELLEHRLTDKETQVALLILQGLTNDAIASQLDITTRTVKAHVSSIFSKLHINDRLSLVLLLK